MSDDSFDDGLVHGHAWSFAQTPCVRAPAPVADAAGARTPSTAMHDDRLFRD